MGYVEYVGMSYEQASREALKIVESAAKKGKTLGDLADRLRILREISRREELRDDYEGEGMMNDKNEIVIKKQGRNVKSHIDISCMSCGCEYETPVSFMVRCVAWFQSSCPNCHTTIHVVEEDVIDA